MKLSAQMQKVLEAIRDGYRVTPSHYLGRFGTVPAQCRKEFDHGGGFSTTFTDPVSISQATIDALRGRNLVTYEGTRADRRVVLTDAGRALLAGKVA